MKNTHDFSPVKGKYVNLREVEISDAAFILSLRTDPVKSRFLHKTDNDINKQIEYLKNYKTLSDEWYFIIERKNHEPIGTVRIYNVKDDTYTGGSWLMVNDATPQEVFEGDLLFKYYTYEVLDFNKCVFDVRKNNLKVVRFHKICGAQIVDETKEDYIFKSSKKIYFANKDRLLNMLG